MNSSKNKLNSEIILIFNPNPNAHQECSLQWSNISSANKGCFIAFDHRRSLSPFCASAACLCQVQILLFPKMVTPLARAKDPPLQPMFPFLCSQLFHVQGLDLATSTLSRALASVTYKANSEFKYMEKVIRFPRDRHQFRSYFYKHFMEK